MMEKQAIEKVWQGQGERGKACKQEKTRACVFGLAKPFSLRGLWQEVSGRIREKQALYASNKALAKDVTRMPFADVLRAWGIENEEEKRAVVRGKEQEALFGLLLSILGLIGFFSAVDNCFASLAALSIALLGLLLWGTGRWRVHCLTKGQFTPFVRWVLGKQEKRERNAQKD